MSLPHHDGLNDEHGRMMSAFGALATFFMWLPWRVGPARANGKASKVPVVPATGRSEGWADEGASVTYDEAAKYAEANGLDGVGIVMSPATAGTCIALDLDDAIDEHGMALPWAREIVQPMGVVETYVETSPSGKGFRVLAYDPKRENIQANGNSVELYDGTSKRFLTITGRRLKSAPNCMNKAPKTIRAARARAAMRADGASQGGSSAQVSTSSGTKAKAPQASGVAPLADLSLDTLRSALAAVPCAGMSYDAWLKVGMAIHAQTGGSPEGEALFVEWCERDAAGLKDGEPEAKWASFSASDNGVTAKYVLKLAGDKGWKQPRRDVTASFDKAEGEDGGDAKGATGSKGGQTDNPETWPALKPLGGKAPVPAGRWVPGTLPAMMECFAQAIADMLGGSVEAVLGMMLPIMGAMVPGAVSFAPRGADNLWRVPILFFAALVGAPGSLKSPILSALQEPITSKEKQWRREHKRDEAKWTREVERLKAEKQKDFPPRPVQRRRSTTSATLEGHAKLVARTMEAIITLADELSMFFGSFDKFTGTGATGGTDRPYWLSAYEGKDYHSDRADAAKCISVESVKASVIGGIQPGVLASVLSVLTTDGLAARFLFVPTGKRNLSKDIVVDQGRAAIYALAGRLVLELTDGDFGAAIELVGDDDAKAVSREAEALGLGWMNALPENDPLRDIAAKAHGFVARLTAALHVIQWAEQEASLMVMGMETEARPLPLVVTGATARKALAIFREYYWVNARRTYAAALSAAANSDAADMAEFVKAWPVEKDGFTASEVIGAINRFRGKDNAALAAAASTLEKANWLRREAKSGGTRWTINPAVRAAE